MAIAFVKNVANNSGTSGSGTGTLALTIPAGGVAAGNLLIVVATIANSGATCTVTDTQGNTYQSDQTSNTTARAIYVLSTIVTTALVSGNTVTATFSGFTGTSFATRISAYEFSGITNTSWKDKSTVATGTSTAPSSGNTATTAQANELLFGACYYANAGLTYTQGTGYTKLEQYPATGTLVATEYQIVSATGAYAANGTITSAAWTQAIVTYKAAASAGNTSNFFRFM